MSKNKTIMVGIHLTKFGNHRYNILWCTYAFTVMFFLLVGSSLYEKLKAMVSSYVFISNFKNVLILKNIVTVGPKVSKVYIGSRKANHS